MRTSWKNIIFAMRIKSPIGPYRPRLKVFKTFGRMATSIMNEVRESRAFRLNRVATLLALIIQPEESLLPPNPSLPPLLALYLTPLHSTPPSPLALDLLFTPSLIPLSPPPFRFPPLHQPPSWSFRGAGYLHSVKAEHDGLRLGTSASSTGKHRLVGCPIKGVSKETVI